MHPLSLRRVVGGTNKRAREIVVMTSSMVGGSQTLMPTAD